MPEYATIKTRMSKAKRRMRRGHRNTPVANPQKARQRTKVALLLFFVYFMFALALMVYTVGREDLARIFGREPGSLIVKRVAFSPKSEANP